MWQQLYPVVIYIICHFDAKIYPDIQELYSIIDGNVGEIPVYLGQEVKEGQVLLKFDDEGMKDELSRLEKQLEETKKNNKYANIQANLDIEISKLNLAKKIADQATTIEITQTIANIEKQELLQKQALELQEFSIKNIEEKIEELKTKLSNSTIKVPMMVVLYILKILGLMNG